MSVSRSGTAVGLPAGWQWLDPSNAVRPWRAVRWDPLGGLKVEIEGATREQAIEWAVTLEAGAAAVVRPKPSGWVFNRQPGFVP